MANSSDDDSVRRVLEQRLADAVRSLRKHRGEGNITLHLADVGDLVAIMPMDDDEAKELARLLARDD